MIKDFSPHIIDDKKGGVNWILPVPPLPIGSDDTLYL